MSLSKLERDRAFMIHKKTCYNMVGSARSVYLRLTFLAIDAETLKDAQATSREMYRAVSLLFLRGAERAGD